MIKYTTLFTFLIGIIASANGQVSSITSEDYERAASMLRKNTRSMVKNANISPRWAKGNLLTYQLTTQEGIKYKTYNPLNNKINTYNSRLELNQALDNNPVPRRSYSEVVSPDGSKAIYIENWNLYLKDLKSGETKALTKDGVKDYGYATDNAGWRKSDRPILSWSPDGNKIITYRQDQRHINNMYLVTTNVGAPKLQAWKYPLPEDEKVILIERLFIDLKQGTTIPLQIAPDPRRGTLCDDISCSGEFDDNVWSHDGKNLVFVSSSRDHKVAQVRMADTETGIVKEIFKEVVPTQYESGQGSINWTYLSETNEIIWYSERSDFGHLYLYDAESGQLKNQITSGDFVVTQVLHVDQKNRSILFYGKGKEEGDPYFSYLYKIKMDGSGLTLLTPEIANHRVSLSSNGAFFVDQYSTPQTPPIALLRDTNGKLIDTLARADIGKLIAHGWKQPRSITVKSADGNYDLYGLMFTPSNLDPTRKYPIINYIYPGPQGGSVGARSFSPSRRDHQALAELGFIVVAIEGSCNPNRSKSFHDACYGDMSVNTLPDQIAGMKQLAADYDFIDLEKVGIWGHSGGGFATATAMMDYPDFFDVGIAESGNHDNRNYEDDWGERYVGLLKGDNYEKMAVQNKAKNLKGKLMLAHGAMDDNVPPYNTYLVVDALIKANKDFDLIIFPHARHGFGKDSNYMTRRRWDYFVKHLHGIQPPKEFSLN